MTWSWSCPLCSVIYGYTSQMRVSPSVASFQKLNDLLKNRPLEFLCIVWLVLKMLPIFLHKVLLAVTPPCVVCFYGFHMISRRSIWNWLTLLKCGMQTQYLTYNRTYEFRWKRWKNMSLYAANTLRLRKYGCYFTDDIFNLIDLYENYCIWFKVTGKKVMWMTMHGSMVLNSWTNEFIDAYWHK